MVLNPNSTRHQQILRTLVVILILNWLVSSVKFLLGWKLNSLTITTDAIHSFLDGASNIVGIIAMMIAARPADENHPYGHHKYEVVATMALSGLLFLSAFEILKSVIHRIFHPVQFPDFSWTGVALLVATIIVNIIISRYELKKGKELNSGILQADSMHTRADIWATFLSILSLLTSFFSWYWVDLVAATGIVALMAHASYQIISDSILTVSDGKRLDENEIRTLVEKVPGVLDAHAIRSRGTAQEISLDLHIQIDETITAREVFEIENNVAQTIKQQFPNVRDVAIRHEPRGVKDEDSLS